MLEQLLIYRPFCTKRNLALPTGVVLVFMLVSLTGMAQEQPFSRKDSAEIARHRMGYDKAIQSERTKVAAHHLNEIAFLYWNHNNYTQAIEDYEKSLELNRQVGNENGVAMLSSNLGMLYSDISEYQNSLEYFKVTLATRRANKEKMGIIAALINISVVQNNLKLFEDSTKNLSEALELSREINDVDLMRSCYGMLSETYQLMGNIEKSLFYFEFYKSFHELSQKQKIDDVETALAQEKRLSESLAVERENLHIELLARQGKIAGLTHKIVRADSTLQSLNRELDSKELMINYLNQEKELLALKAEQEVLEIKHQVKIKRGIFIISSLIIVFLSCITLLVVNNRRRIKSKNELLTEQNAQIMNMNQDLQKTNRVKDTLFSIIGHDLRAPLAMVLQATQYLDDETLSKEEHDFMLRELRLNQERASLLLENLLAWAKNQMSGQTLSITDFILMATVDQGLHVLESLYLSKDIELEKNYHYQGTVHADKEMVNTVVRNLCSNAIKFTPNGGKIQVCTEREGHWVCLKVIDNGIGMNQDQIDNLFNGEFKSTYGTNSEKGMGMGLTLCKNFIDLMKGELHVQSEPGVGTTFIVKLPTTEI